MLEVLESSDPAPCANGRIRRRDSTGRIDAQGDMTSAEGLRCRRLQLRTQVRGLQSLFAFPFCKSPEGEWFIASGMKFSDDDGPLIRRLLGPPAPLSRQLSTTYNGSRCDRSMSRWAADDARLGDNAGSNSARNRNEPPFRTLRGIMMCGWQGS